MNILSMAAHAPLSHISEIKPFRNKDGELQIGPHKDITPTLILLSMLFFGGYPVLTPQSFLTRSNSDGLTDELSVMKILHDENTELHEIVLSFCNIPFRTVINYAELLEDTFSLNMLKPPNPKTAIRFLIEDHLCNPGVTTNNPLREYFQLGLQRNQGISDFLASVTPFRPRILKEIYGALPSSKAREMLARFDATNNIINLSTKERGREIFRSLKT
ncbi:Uncharacterised protein at_DN0265 [Pycnogonum litorale]